jgi:hypothetical protein
VARIKPWETRWKSTMATPSHIHQLPEGDFPKIRHGKVSQIVDMIGPLSKAEPNSRELSPQKKITKRQSL